MKTHPDTKSQTVGILEDIKKLLESQKLTMGDIVMIHVYLGNNPATDGKPDFAGLTAGYTQFFGTKEQPRKAARTTMQVDSARCVSRRVDRSRRDGGASNESPDLKLFVIGVPGP